MPDLPPLMSNALEVLRDYLQSPISADQSERHGTAWLALNQLQFCCHQLQEQVDDGLQAAKEREETIRILEDVCHELREERKAALEERNAALDALAHVANHVGHYGISIDDPANLARTIVAEFDTRIRSRDARIAELEVKLRRAERAQQEANRIDAIPDHYTNHVEHYLSVEKVDLDGMRNVTVCKRCAEIARGMKG